MAAALVTALLLGVAAYHISGKRSAGLLAAALFLGNPVTVGWAGYARVDLLAIMFTVLGVWLIYRAENSYIRVGLGGILLAAAIFTRQTAILAGLLAGSVLLWHQKRRMALFLLAWVGLISLVGYLVLNEITAGGFYLNVITANVNRFELRRVISGEWLLLRTIPVIVLIGLIKTTQGLLTPASRQQAAKVGENAFLAHAWPYFTLGAIIITLSVGKSGSDINYFIEFVAACSLWVAVVLVIDTPGTKISHVVIRAILLLQMIWLGLGGIVKAQEIRANTWDRLEAVQELEELVKVAGKEGPILSDNLDLVLQAGQPIYYQPVEYWLLNDMGLWEPAKLAEEITQQHFPFIYIGRQDFWPAELMAAMLDSYEILSEDGHWILIPQSSPDK